MKKLAGLLAFAVALAGAILLTQHYSTRPAPPPSTPAAAPASSQAPSAPAALARDDAHVTFKTQLVTLDFAAKKSHVTLNLERDPAGPAPEKIWVWAYFFTPDAPGRYCAADPVELRQPFAAGNRATVNVEAPLADCPAPRAPSSTYYARVNVSAESAFAARLNEQRISYDISQASPAVVEGAQPKHH
ncbi:MAG: hypothetical protein M3444_14620 [Acidobacteriota bacterium]|nr:hypothetical protein [Acidobacteriota bacterium]MDQ5837516.1 hypothetical protein [Acidobacteriota bacterium]